MEVLDAIDDAALPAYIGDGFRDLSRTAAADPTIWSDILQANREAISPLARQLGARLTIDDDKAALRQRITKARALRLGLDAPTE